MNRYTISSILLLLSGVLTLSTNPVAAQGSLTPPGAPAPAMKSLDQIYSQVAALVPANPLVLNPILASTQQGAIHLLVTGQKLGVFKGPCTIKNLENTIVCVDYSHSIITPRDASTGLPTGRRVHKPLTITKYVDQTTPLFFSALVNNENLTDVSLRFYQTDTTGKTINIFLIKLTNANIASIDSAYPNTETIAFVYQSIQWTQVPTGLTASDDWAPPI